jgi:hypothetical protein
MFEQLRAGQLIGLIWPIDGIVLLLNVKSVDRNDLAEIRKTK